MFRWQHPSARREGRRPQAPRLSVESLEERLVLSTVPVGVPAPLAPAALAPQHAVLHPAGGLAPASSPGPVGLQPAQVRHAYGFDQVSYTGAGQTIAIIDAYDDPNIGQDLAQFDSAFGLPAPPSFRKVAQDGSTSYPGVDPSAGWETEEAMDVEWAHALAPQANILLVEANSSSLSDLDTAVDYARHQSGVSVVSMSYGGSEFSGESGYDGLYTTPAGHASVTFVAAAGDSGAPPIYPAASPNVLAVGGTTLSLSPTGAYAGESGWSGSGGGLSSYEAQPAYQHGVVTQSATQRANPDVAFDADPASGVAVCNSYSYGSAAPWVQVGGTSFSAPAWGALLAVADQGRALNNEAPLDGPGQALPALYQLPATDFHDVTSGNNGYPAGPGYDLVTGRGSPVANQVVADLVQPPAPQPSAAATHFGVTVSAPAVTAGAAFSVTVQALDGSGHVVTGYAGTVHFTSTDPRAGLPADYTFTAVDGGAHTFTGVILRTAGSQTVTATDAAAALTGSATVTVNPAAATTLVVSGFPTSVTAGSPGRFTVTARDAYGNVATGYAGTVHFTSSDPRAVLPADYTFVSTDAGVHSFSATLKTAGLQSLTATDKASAGTTGTEGGIRVNPAALNTFKVSAPATGTAGLSFTVTVTAQDAYGNTVTGYAGTVHFRSSDRKAVLPANYTFTAADAGVHAFTVTLRTVGTESITVNDTVRTWITGTAVVKVVSGTSTALVTSSTTSTGGAALPAGASTTAALPPSVAARDLFLASLGSVRREWAFWAWAVAGRKSQPGTDDWLP